MVSTGQDKKHYDRNDDSGGTIKSIVHAPTWEGYICGGRTMLVLMKGEVTRMPSIPPEKFFEMAIKQTQSLKEYYEQGKILAGGIIAGRKGSYAIWDVDSIEELQKYVSQLSMFPFGDYEFIPLISYENAQESSKKIQATV